MLKSWCSRTMPGLEMSSWDRSSPLQPTYPIWPVLATMKPHSRWNFIVGFGCVLLPSELSSSVTDTEKSTMKKSDCFWLCLVPQPVLEQRTAHSVIGPAQREQLSSSPAAAKVETHIFSPLLKIKICPAENSSSHTYEQLGLILLF